MSGSGAMSADPELLIAVERTVHVCTVSKPFGPATRHSAHGHDADQHGFCCPPTSRNRVDRWRSGDRSGAAPDEEAADDYEYADDEASGSTAHTDRALRPRAGRRRQRVEREGERPHHPPEEQVQPESDDQRTDQAD